MAAKDARAGAVDEALRGVRAVKLLAWEGPVLDGVRRAREAELRLVRRRPRTVFIVS